MKPSTASDTELLDHMLDCIAHIREYTQGRRTVFFGSPMVQDAVVRNLHTFTESSQRLSDDVKAAEPTVDWRRMSGMRNILVHAYLGGIDLETVWAVIEQELPELEQGLERQRHRLAPKGDRGKAS